MFRFDFRIVYILPLVLFFLFCGPTVDVWGQFSADDAEEYVIGAGDILEVRVFGEQDVSAKVIVRIDGRISLPLAGEIQAAGKTLAALTNNIEGRLEKFIEAPEVTVMLSEGRSKTYYIIGEIASPGEYDISRKFTVLQAIARAGGFGEWAKKNRIMIVSEGGEEQNITYFNYDDFLRNPDSAKNVTITPGDTIVVP